MSQLPKPAACLRATVSLHRPDRRSAPHPFRQGQNRLGRAIMRVRESLRDSEVRAPSARPSMLLPTASTSRSAKSADYCNRPLRSPVFTPCGSGREGPVATRPVLGRRRSPEHPGWRKFRRNLRMRLRVRESVRHRWCALLVRRVYWERPASDRHLVRDCRGVDGVGLADS
jgi:hypothetical protein